ncbi:MAG: knotted carbamoyltransferase YgeW, partial [Mogibacterium sp.]|nr:knotted carbamoyltransferase YgeW [Mogibacterium sp.]
AQNAEHMDWLVDDEMMKLTKNGLDTLYMHPLPADIQGLSCEHGEVTAKVFDHARDSLYKEASNKPYVIAAMIFLAKVKDPVAALKILEETGTPRKAF